MLTLQVHPKLTKMAECYVWWESSEWAYQHPTIFIANAMNLATWKDMQNLLQLLDTTALKYVLQHAPPGYFHQRSWDYWHLKLGIKNIPPLPKRNFQ